MILCYTVQFFSSYKYFLRLLESKLRIKFHPTLPRFVLKVEAFFTGAIIHESWIHVTFHLLILYNCLLKISLSMVCKDVEVEPVLQDIIGEELNRVADIPPDARLDIVARRFWERRRSAFFDVRACHPNADSYRDMDPDQTFRQHETERKRPYASRVLEVDRSRASHIHTISFQRDRWNGDLVLNGLLLT